MKNYSLIDSGNLKKLEKFGPYLISRPCAAAIWRPKLDNNIWKDADIVFIRDSKNKWVFENKKKVDNWIVEIEDIKLKLKLTDFGHIGFFQEHVFLANKLSNIIGSKIFKDQNKSPNILNLFAYTGLMSLFALKNSAKVCHVDSSKPSILWAKENVELNNFQNLEIRYILDDALKFVKREVKRGSKYDGIILDPPSFGRGAKGEVFKIETDLYLLLDLLKKLLANTYSFIIFSTHSPGFSKISIKNLFTDIFEKKGSLEIEELCLKSENSYDLPSGYYAIWQKDDKKF